MAKKRLRTKRGDLLDASLIFKATIIRLNRSNEASVPSGRGLATAKIDAVYKANPHLGNLVAQELTIRLSPSQPPPTVGEQAIFYAADWVYGDHIAVQELARRGATDATEKAVAEAVQRLPERHLQQRLAGADLVVTGRVENIEDSTLDEPLTFNAPRWKVANLTVETVLKASRSATSPTSARVLFPTSDDWRAPQLAAGQSGVFILRRGQKLGIPRGYLLALDPADVQTSGALERVRSLLPGRSGGR